MLETIKFGYEIGRNVWVTNTPSILYLKPTTKCGVQCKSCDRWKDETLRAKNEEMSLQEIQEVLAKMRKAGTKILTLWGGEPTLRPDLPEILDYAKALGYRITMCSNCLGIPKKADKILSKLDLLYVSLDAFKEKHDEFRGVKGLFNIAEKTIQLSKNYPTCEVKVWASVHTKSVDDLAPLADFAKSYNIGIEYFPLTRFEGYNNDIVLQGEEHFQAFETVIALKKAGYPIDMPLSKLKLVRDNKSFRCNIGAMSVQVDHKGNIYTCEGVTDQEPHYSWQHHDNFDPVKVRKSKHYKSLQAELRDCNRCRLPCVIETSGSPFMSFAEMFVNKWAQYDHS